MVTNGDFVADTTTSFGISSLALHLAPNVLHANPTL